MIINLIKSCPDKTRSLYQLFKGENAYKQKTRPLEYKIRKKLDLLWGLTIDVREYKSWLIISKLKEGFLDIFFIY